MQTTLTTFYGQARADPNSGQFEKYLFPLQKESKPSSNLVLKDINTIFVSTSFNGQLLVQCPDKRTSQLCTLST